MSESDDYNAGEWAAKRINGGHVSQLTRRFQIDQGLPVDGKCGPTTRAVLDLLDRRAPGLPPPHDLMIADGWLKGDGVTVVPIHRSWYYEKLDTGTPRAIVAHYTSTDPGTAKAMAEHRVNAFRKGVDRAASWHVSIEADGSIWQMAPFTAGCWHAGGPTAKPIPHLGPANRTAVGLELVGQGKLFPAPQVDAAARVWRALVFTYQIDRGLAMVTHAELDPGRKVDPGPVWMSEHAPHVLTFAYA